MELTFFHFCFDFPFFYFFHFLLLINQNKLKIFTSPAPPLYPLFLFSHSLSLYQNLMTLIYYIFLPAMYATKTKRNSEKVLKAWTNNEKTLNYSPTTSLWSFIFDFTLTLTPPPLQDRLPLDFPTPPTMTTMLSTSVSFWKKKLTKTFSILSCLFFL